MSGQKKEKVCKPDWPRGQRVAHSLLGTDLAHSSFQVCRCRPVVYVMPVISELACGAQSAQCISLKRFYEPQGCRMEAPPSTSFMARACSNFNGPFWAHSAWQLSVFDLRASARTMANKASSDRQIGCNSNAANAVKVSTAATTTTTIKSSTGCCRCCCFVCLV